MSQADTLKQYEAACEMCSSIDYNVSGPFPWPLPPILIR